jgi:hypothetical protein
VSRNIHVPALVVGIVTATLALGLMVDAQQPASPAPQAAPSAPPAALDAEPVALALPPAPSPSAAPRPPRKAQASPAPAKPKPARTQKPSRSAQKVASGWGQQWSASQVRALLRATAPRGTGSWEVESGVCIAMRESHGWTQIPNQAGSSAGGLWQIVKGTWGGHDGYARAYQAPPVSQAERFWQVWDGGAGRMHWNWPPKQCW